MNKEQLQSFLIQPYQRAGWLDTLRKVLPRTEIFTNPQRLITADDRAEAVFQLGRVRLRDDRQLGILEVKMDESIDLARNRVELRNLVARFIDQAEYHGMLSVFLTPSSDYRFTFAARESAFEDGGLVRRETAPRRYTYLLGPGESCRTPAERFAQLSLRGEAAQLQDVIEAFNVDKLNKEFFNDFRHAFNLLKNDILERNARVDEHLAEREAQTLLNRLLFLCFVQRKGWLNRQRDYLFRHFRAHIDKKPDGLTFYQEVLKPLFIKLATEGNVADIPDQDLPFLNGGLFADEYGAEQRDEIARRRYSLKIGNGIFHQIFTDLLEAYNFTVREDSPLSVEVAIDPEMLGKVFESLVLQLEQSGTGGKTSRHDTGSYYTPRPIVHYLCREGLRAWLEQYPPDNLLVPDWSKRLEKLLSLDASEGLSPTERARLDACINSEEARSILDRLDTFRACDPAVGSGAFPVGLLHELLNLRRLCETRSRGKDPVDADTEWFYTTKARIIERCIYGVDIQERAIEICKLRLWLSLMVDHPLEADVDSCSAKAFRDALKKITPLPNLDFKIRRANSLIDVLRGHPIRLDRISKEDKTLPQVLSRLTHAKHLFYEAHNLPEKRRLQFEILDATAELARLELGRCRLDIGNSLLAADNHADAERILQLDQAMAEMNSFRSQLEAARKLKSTAAKDEALEKLSDYFNDPKKPTFVWQLDFAEVFHRAEANRCGKDLLDAAPSQKPGGFDLVLANPPYVRQEKIKDLKPLLQRSYDCYTGVADLYVYFYERSVRLLRPGGVLSFISSNKFFRAGYGEKLRKFLADNTQIRTIVDFGELPLFENAATFPMIFIAQKGMPKRQSLFAQIKSLDAPYPDMSALVKQQGNELPITAIGGSKWRLADATTADLLGGIESAGIHLNAYVNKQISYGVKTGFNTAFVIDSAKRSELIKADKKSSHLIKPLAVGDDIRRWRINRRDRWLIFTRRGTPIEQFPAIKAHLEKWRRELEPRPRDWPANGEWPGRKPGSYKWYEIQDEVAYHELFDQPKIVFPDIAKEPRFAFDSEGLFTNDTTFIISAVDYYLLGILNSPVVWTYLRQTAAVLGDAENGGRMRLKRFYVETIPIAKASDEERSKIANLVEWLLWLNAQPTVTSSVDSQPRDPLIATYFEQWLNALVYELYFRENLAEASLRFFQITTEHSLPSIKEWNESERLEKIRGRFEMLYDLDHPLRQHLFSLGSLEFVRAIEGRD